MLKMRSKRMDIVNGTILVVFILIYFIFLNGNDMTFEEEVLQTLSLQKRRSISGNLYDLDLIPMDSRINNFIKSVPGRSSAMSVPVIKFIAMQETLREVVNDKTSLHRSATVIEYSGAYNKKYFVKLVNTLPDLIGTSNYVTRNPRSLTLVFGNSSSRWDPNRRKLTQVSDYFRYLHTAQAHCRKLVRIGGQPTCQNRGDDNDMDGNKLVCFDPELELGGSRDPSSCLVFSYGVNYDTTFDEGIAILPCEVHLFDKVYYNTAIVDAYPHTHFHQVGISNTHVKEFYSNLNETFLTDTLVGQVLKNNLTGRPMHILKMDIEDGEWKTFESLKGNKFLDLVGQIALEVHATELLNKTKSEQLPYVQRRYEVLKDIEDSGFRLVAYWDNHNKKIEHELGNGYNLCGELLYVNRKWYNSTFKSQLRDQYKFKFKLNLL